MWPATASPAAIWPEPRAPKYRHPGAGRDRSFLAAAKAGHRPAPGTETGAASGMASQPQTTLARAQASGYSPRHAHLDSLRFPARPSARAGGRSHCRRGLDRRRQDGRPPHRPAWRAVGHGPCADARRLRWRRLCAEADAERAAGERARIRGRHHDGAAGRAADLLLVAKARIHFHVHRHGPARCISMPTAMRATWPTMP